jgi:ubiquinone/menaquinone biosynthesis C-methylase UbiE
MQIEQATMEQLMPPLADRVVLDLACGTGRYMLFARTVGARIVVGVDNSRAMLLVGSMRPTAEASMIDLPFAAQSIDVVISGLALGHIPVAAMRRAIAEIARVLRCGGEAMLSDFHPFLALSGGQRAFRAPDSKLYAVEHYPHLASDYFDAVKAAGMSVSAMAEPRAEVKGRIIPAVLVVRFKR